MKRNAYAKALSSPLFKKKIILSKKTYSRKKTKITFTKNFQQQKNFLLEKKQKVLSKGD